MTYELIRSNRKTIAQQIKGDGRIIVRAPLRMTAKDIQRFVSVYGRKIKLLEVKRILEEQTDEEHCLSAGIITQQLEEVGIPAAR